MLLVLGRMYGFCKKKEGLQGQVLLGHYYFK